MPKPKIFSPRLREPLTQKARSAIQTYVILQGNKKGNYLSVLVKACLAAERMKRGDLYAWLEAHGYTWKKGYWKAAQSLKTEGG